MADTELTEMRDEAPASGGAKQERKSSTFIVKEPHGKGAELRWDNVSYGVDTSAGHLQILENCHGSVQGGELACCIGPSGAGKTTLLDILSARIVNGLSKETSITLNGEPQDQETFSAKIAYVTQEDAIFPTSTPRECFTFSAKLRLDKSTTDEEIEALVDEMIVRLGLQKCADNLVGSVLVRGISGGEKKRTAIGIELVTNPGILFLDEPTSGLDSFAAFNVVQLLKDLAHSGTTVISTIHQPSSEIFEIFDKVIMLANKGTVYGGSNKDLVQYFADRGHQCPTNYNPADFALFLLQTQTQPVLDDLVISWREKRAELQEAKSESAEKKELQNVRRHGFSTQLLELSRRELRDTIRDKQSLGARFGMTIFLNLLFGLIFLDAGDKDGPINAHFGALTQIGIGAMFGAAQPMLLKFPLERPVFLREYATSMYGIVPYFISKAMVELPLGFITSLVIFLTSYWTIGFQGNFFYLTVIAWLLGLVASSSALLLGCLLSNIKVAMELAPLIFVPQILFAGFFIAIELIPVWLRWVQYLCSLKFAMNLFLVAEFQHCDSFADPQGCRDVKTSNDVDDDDWWIYGLVLIGLFVAFRALALYALRAKARR